MLTIIGVLAVIGYLYVALAAGKAEYKSGSGAVTVAVKAATWPLTIWNTIDKLYFTRPGQNL